jgi:hypothetical protein
LPACGGQGGDKKSSAVNADATAIRTRVLETRQERVFLSLDILSKVEDAFCHQK